MTASSKYFDQVQLLMNVLPTVRKESSLALKGGPAINLFYRGLPNLSVDIDLHAHQRILRVTPAPL